MAETPGFVNIRKNIVHFPSMPRSLRILTGLGIAQVLVGTLLLLFHDVEFPSVIVSKYQDHYVNMGLPFVFLGTLLLVTGWTYLLSGALQARWWIAFGGLLLFTLSSHEALVAFGGWQIALPAGLGLWAFFVARKAIVRTHAPPILVDVVAIGLLVFAVNVAPIILYEIVGDGSRLLEYSIDVSGQVSFLLPVLIPMLLIAGVDLAEISTEAGSWLTDHVLEHTPVRVAVAGLLALAAVKIWVQWASGYSAKMLALTAAPTAVGVVGLFIALRYLFTYSTAQREEEKEGDETASPSFGMLLVLAYALFIVFILASSALGFLNPYSAASDAAVHVPTQVTWSVAGLVAILIAGGGMIVARLRKRRFPAALVFLLLYGLWICVSVGNPVAFFRAPDAGRSTIDPLVRMPQLDVAVSIVAAVTLGVLARARRLTREALGLVAAVLVGISLVSGVSALYDQQLSVTDLVTLGQVALVLGVLTFGLARTLRHERTRRAGRVLAIAGLAVAVPLLIGVAALVVASMTNVLPKSYKVPSEAPAVVVFAMALCWDLLMSGGRFTNFHGPRLPRHGRVLMYVGYVSLVAAALLWMKSLRGLPDDVFNDTVLPSFGLLVLGIPVAIYLWALGIRRLWPVGVPAEAGVG